MRRVAPIQCDYTRNRIPTTYGFGRCVGYNPFNGIDPLKLLRGKSLVSVLFLEINNIMKKYRLSEERKNVIKELEMIEDEKYTDADHCSCLAYAIDYVSRGKVYQERMEEITEDQREEVKIPYSELPTSNSQALREESLKEKKQHADKCEKEPCTCDGYHTFNELYEHRIRLWIELARFHWVWRTKIHSDGSQWDGWFILGYSRGAGEQITYHLPMRYWDECDFANTRKKAPKYDGHTSYDVLERLKTLRVKYADSWRYLLDKKYKMEEITEQKEETQNAIQECYLQCLAVECGEGECARAIATRFPEYVNRYNEGADY